MDLSPSMSPDTVSSLFPDRPIRPLPKRRLRERLSPELAGSIKYPPSTHVSAPLFYYPAYTAKDDVATARSSSPNPAARGRHVQISPGQPTPRTELRSRDGQEYELNSSRGTPVTLPTPDILSRNSRRLSKPDPPRHIDTQPPPSAPSSVDGYDSFENTNNKKKRKIPTASDTALNGSHALNNEIGALTISPGVEPSIGESPLDRAQASSAYASPGPMVSSSPGISGPGRGRIGRSRNGRSPLRTLPDGGNTWAGKSTRPGAPQWAQADHGSSGIISSAIANAGKLPPVGQENVSLLQQQSTTSKTTPVSTQFTFTCDSQVPGTVPWPGHEPRHSINSQVSSSMTGQGTGAGGRSHRDDSSRIGIGGPDSSRRRSRRRLERELIKAAHDRYQITLANNRQNPPREEEFWFCEFCEYERIFGEPPRALIREYELKDRRHRQEEADRRRLLEKAKAKSRKGKKAGKLNNKGQNSAGHTVDHSHGEAYDAPGAHSMHAGHSHSTQSEEDYDDGYEEQYQESSPTAIHGNGGGVEMPVSFREEG